MNQTFLLLCFLLAASCARPVMPSGGPRDTSPPSIVEASSSPNYRTGFQKQDIRLTFDEFVVLDRAETQVLISPPLQYRPKITLKDKTVHFKFDDREELKPNTTYIINFGASIKDFREGNTSPALLYVFSTGDVLDSLTLRVRVITAADLAPADGAVVMLYNDMSDSAVYKINPAYVARTGKDGRAQLGNMKAGTYQLIALKDENFNFRYDLSNEQAGFHSENITLPYTGPDPELRLFSRSTPVRILAVDTLSPQRVRLILDPGTAGVRIKPLEGEPFGVPEVLSKSFDLYYTSAVRRASFIIERPGFKPDTFRLHLTSPQSYRTVRFAEEAAPLKLFPVTPGREAVIYLNTMLAGIVPGNIHLRKSGMDVPFDIRLDSTQRRAIRVKASWMPDSVYTLRFDKNALLDVAGNENDTFVTTIRVSDPETLGSVSIRMDSLNPLYDYRIELVKEQTVWAQWLVKEKTSFQSTTDNLPSDIYEIRIHEDRNRNGVVDKGNFDRKELPEDVYKRKLDQLRQNWTIEVEMNMQDFISGQK